MTRSSLKDCIIVSVDFGTTYSGAAYAYRGKPEPVERIPVIKGWAEGDNHEKVPTELRYEDVLGTAPRAGLKRRSRGGVEISPNTKGPEITEWGFEVNKDKDYIRFIKLLLEPHRELPEFVDREGLLSQLRDVGKTPIDAAADYLRKLKEQIDAGIAKRFGDTMGSKTKFIIVFTVPAVWTDAAKDATMEAARKAGLIEGCEFYTITEPEAAALCVLKQMEDINLSAGDNWIVCDAGGGTVDLISYQVHSLAPLRFGEAVSGNGGLCGSGLLNLRFEEQVKSKMGAKAFGEFRTKNHWAWGQCLERFEVRTKRDFNPFKFPKKEYSLPLFGAEDNLAAGVESNRITLTRHDLEEIFRPIIDSIFELVDEQRKSFEENEVSPRGIILVGGFGESAYLLESLKRRYSDSDTGFCVLQPPNAWTAVARGAVLHCLEGGSLVQSRVARRHYGVLNRMPFDEKKHSVDDRVWDDDNDQWYADNQIQWYVKKGETIPTGHKIKMPFHFTARDGLPQECIMLVVSDEKEAPMNFVHTKNTRFLCTIHADLADVPNRRWKTRHTEAGREYVILDYAVSMNFGAGEIGFDMIVGSQVYGTARADYKR